MRNFFLPPTLFSFVSKCNFTVTHGKSQMAIYSFQPGGVTYIQKNNTTTTTTAAKTIIDNENGSIDFPFFGGGTAHFKPSRLPIFPLE